MTNNTTWGGPWTERKLDAFENYVKAYLKIMNNQPWETIYFDGFAGSGSRKKRKSNQITLPISDEEKHVYRGAAERIVRMESPFTFDYYYFVENSQRRLDKLEQRLKSLPESNEKTLVFRTTDCNKELLSLSEPLKTDQYASLVFLDPFGMHVDWSSIESLKNTRSDVWILFPTAVIVNRLLDKKGELNNLPKLESFFGLTEEEIRQEFYIPTGQSNMFDPDEEHFRKVVKPINKIAALYIKKMKEIWKYVTEPALRLDNRNGAPLFHFIFASNNRTALNIAKYIITKS